MTDTYVTCTAADGVYLISEGDDRKLIATVFRTSKERVLRMAAADAMFEALSAFADKMDPACLVENDLRESHLADELRGALAALASAKGEA